MIQTESIHPTKDLPLTQNGDTATDFYRYIRVMGPVCITRWEAKGDDYGSINLSLPCRVILLCLFAFVCRSHDGRLLAQTSRPDSLKIASLINESHNRLISHDYQEAIRIAQQALDLSTPLNFKWGIVNSQLEIAQANKSLSNYSGSLNHYLQALSEIEKQKDPAMLAWVNTRVGELFQEWRVPEKALPHYIVAFQLQPDENTSQSIALIERIAETHKSLNRWNESLEDYQHLLRIMRERKDNQETKRILENIASIYAQMNDTQHSLDYNLQLLEINREMDDLNSEAITLNVIGNQYKELNNPDKALEYYQAALTRNRQSKKPGENDNGIVANLINIGSIHQSRGDTRNAIRSFNEALSIKQKAGTPVEIAVMHNYIATLYLAQGNYPAAEEHTQTSINLLSGTNNRRTLARNYKRLSEIYEKETSHDKALQAFRTYSMLNDSLMYEEQAAAEKLTLKQYQIEATEKEAKLSLIDHEMQALELRNEKEVAEREKKQVELLLKEKELQNVSLQNKQLEQTRAVQQLQLQQEKTDKEKREQEILLLEQKQNAELARVELQEIERKKEITIKNTELALQQSLLERASIRQQYLIYTMVLFIGLVLFVLLGYIIKRNDNRKLQAQFDEINRQKLQIESINKTLIELNEEKNDLIGIVAHDLKSPLNQISGMLEVIKLTNSERPDQLELTQRVEQSTNRLKRMVSKILDVNAIESKTLNIVLEKINVTDLLDEIVNRFTDMAAKKNIQVLKEFKPDVPVIESDRGYVSEVLENLMSNAVKYSPLGKQITLRLSRQAAFVRLEFEDQGQGISAADMKKLFGKYTKLSAKPTAGEDSTGLGLSIVKKYVVALKGKVWCESEEGKGSNFIVELPA